MREIAVAFLLMFSLLGCAKTPQSSESRGPFKVDRLFTIDGVTVYRFEDGASYVYFASRGSTSWQAGSGDSAHPVMVETGE